MPLAADALPTGRVTFAFTDVVGSTRTFIEHGQAYADALTQLHALIAEHTTRWGGVVVETEGDGALLAFPHAASAMEALVGAQREVEGAEAGDLQLRIRCGAHTGDAMPIAGRYLALAVYVAARVSAAAGAGQVLVTDAVIDELDRSGGDATMRAVEVGSYLLKDIDEPMRLWRVAGDATPPRAQPARNTNVQQSRTSFLGREEAMRHLRDLAQVPGLVTVVGPGGVGKTRLVSEFALQEAHSVAGGVWLAELSTLDDAGELVNLVGNSMGVDTAQLGDLIAQAKQRGRCVLVLDNCEHLVDAVVDLAEQLLAYVPDLTVLCTSREALRVAGERLCRLSPLSITGAAQLFVDRAEASRHQEFDHGLVQELCRALDGLPLAIELAASQAFSAPLQELLDGVWSGSDALTRRGGQLRQRSLDEVLEWSLGRLAPATRNALLVLSVFPGRFSPTMARIVLEATTRCDPSATRTLVQGSLIDLDGDDYRLLSTIRDAARRRLRQDATLQAEAMDALAHWAVASAEDHYGKGLTRGSVPYDTLLAIEAALAHGLEVGLPGLGKAWVILDSATGFLSGASPLGLELADRIVSTSSPDEPDVVLAMAAASLLSGFQGGGARLSADQVEGMLRVARSAGDPVLLERVLSCAAFQHVWGDGDLRASLTYWEEARRLAETAPLPRQCLTGAICNMANSHLFLGDLARAEELFLHALELDARAGDDLGVAIARVSLSVIALASGRPVEGRDHALAALHCAPPNWNGRCLAIAALARAHAALADKPSAIAAGRQALPGLLEMAPYDTDAEAELKALIEAIPELAAE